MPRAKVPANQQAIAEKLGLSIATVSRSLADHPAISVETRARVAEAARQLGYVRHEARRAALKAGEARGTIGVLVGLQPNSSPLATFPAILKGLHERAKMENVSVEVAYVDPNQFDPQDRADANAQAILDGKWQGVILVYSFSTEIVQSISERIPVVATLEDYGGLKVDSIDTNHHTGVVALVSRLVELGHQRIGFATWTYPITGYWVTQRFSAYVAGIFNHGLTFNPEWILNMHKGEAALNPEEIADKVVRLLRREKVTAWVCPADHQAYQLMLGLNSRGVRVPQDCSITGFDGIEPPLSLKPMTTLHVPNETIGAAALSRLMNRIAHPKAHQRKILVETQFVEGSTVAPAAR